MKNPFEAPKQEAPQEESFDIDVSDLDGTPPGGMKEFTPEELGARAEELERELGPERDRERAAQEKVVESFFAKNPFLKKRFEKDPGALSRFKEGLAQLVMSRSRAYQTEPEDLPADPRFQEDLVKYSFEFEGEEAKRNAGRRAA